MTTPLITRDALATALAGAHPPIVLEALPDRYWRDGHIPGAYPVPPAELADRLARYVPDRSAEIVVYCASATCANSHQVAARMRQMGYDDVKVYAGGKADWVDGGLALATAE